MPMTDGLLQQAMLLFEQRLVMQGSRYLTLPQLRQHDYQLIDCLQLLHSNTATQDMPLWLHWLLSDDCGVLAYDSVAHWAEPNEAWLLLHELKAVKHRDKVQQLMQQLIAQHSDMQSLAWQYAWRQQLKFDSVLLNDMTDFHAFWYLGTQSQAEQIPALQGVMQQPTSQHPVNVYARLAAYLLGDKSDEVKLVSMLCEADALHNVALMLLLAGAADQVQSQIINYLAGLDDAGFAIMAMGYSGQLKFVPLLLELAQQHDNSEQACNALSILLGVVDADSLLGAKDVALLLQGKAGRKLAGAVLSEQQLERVVRQGNTVQSQLAACYRFLAKPVQALIHSHALLAGSSQ
jgi:hypothetical protein